MRPGRLDRFGKAGEPVAADDQHVLDAAVGQLGAHTGPKLRALAGLNPDPEHVFDPVHVHTHRYMGSLVAHVSRL